MTSGWKVVTPTGGSVFEGTKPQCKAYLRQALVKGSEPDYLRIVPDKAAKKP